MAAGVKHLFLVHLSRRYSEWDVGREARAIFEHTIVPRDLDQYRITREGVEKVEDGDTSGGR